MLLLPREKAPISIVSIRSLAIHELCKPGVCIKDLQYERM